MDLSVATFVLPVLHIWWKIGRSVGPGASLEAVVAVNLGRLSRT